MNIPSLGLSLGVSRMNIPSDFLDRMAPRMERAYGAMDELEAGSIANPDEGRRVGHYWLRDPDRSPEGSIARAIRGAIARIRTFAADVHAGRIGPAASERFTDVLLIGIGGSALGPQFVADALGDPDSDRMGMHFLDNTDPDGIDRVLRRLGDRLAGTLAVVVSKSGGTAETRNGMLLARAAYEAAGLDFPGRAAAVTGPGSKLDQLAEREGWLLRLPMWDWVGGRTSETGPVGLLPAALRGIDIDALLAGAAACDAATRRHDTPGNPAALMALAWHHATGGAGEKDMVVLPYKDRLLLFSRYLQQLVMESLGKGEDRDGNRVEQGIAVYGNKGSTDQHAYVQQLREGVNNFFVVFIRVLEDEAKVAPAPAGNTEARGGVAADHEIEPGVTAGDYLHGFWLGTREALAEKGRLSMTLTVRRIDAFQIGVLIALFERAVGFYASLVNVNAYHQPGVEAGKKAAAAVLETQRKTLEHLRVADGPADAGRIAEAIGEPGRVETIRHILEHLAANERVIAREGGYEAPAGPR